jgi:hypothetical protein
MFKDRELYKRTFTASIKEKNKVGWELVLIDFINSNALLHIGRLTGLWFLPSRPKG